MAFDLHKTFQDLMREKGDVLSGFHLTGKPEARTHIQVDYFCQIDKSRPYMGPEQGVRPLADLEEFNVIELEGLGNTLDEGRLRYHVGRTLVMENPHGRPSRQGRIGLTILTVHTPRRLLQNPSYRFEELASWKFRTTVMNTLPITIIALRELQMNAIGEAATWFQVLEPDPERRPVVWTRILDQNLSGRTNLQRLMIDIDEEAYMNMVQEIRLEGKREGEREGKREGKREGMRQAKSEVALEMTRMGLDRDLIVKITGIDPVELGDRSE